RSRSVKGKESPIGNLAGKDTVRSLQHDAFIRVHIDDAPKREQIDARYREQKDVDPVRHDTLKSYGDFRLFRFFLNGCMSRRLGCEGFHWFGEPRIARAVHVSSRIREQELRALKSNNSRTGTHAKYAR